MLTGRVISGFGPSVSVYICDVYVLERMQMREGEESERVQIQEVPQMDGCPRVPVVLGCHAQSQQRNPRRRSQCADKTLPI